MSRKRSPARKNRRQPTPSEARAISRRGVETLTIVWMLFVLTAAACELVALLAAVAGRVFEDGLRVRALAELMGFAALVIGLLSLGLMLLVCRLRDEPPPTPILIFAGLVGAAPLAMIVARRWM